jgi:tetratricopeptide (TPR) repeat protein
MRPFYRGLIAFVAVLVLGGLILSLPPVSSRVFNVLEDARVRVRAVIFPANDVAFVPGGQVIATVPTETEAAATFTPTLQPTLAPSQTALPPQGGAGTATPQPSATPAPTATPLPASAALRGVRWETQNGAWNYCGPTNLSMLLSYWGWQGDKFSTGKFLKPFDYDLNVMPYEMQNYVEEKTDFLMKVRYGGTLELIKRLLANGFPVMTEVGVYFPETATGLTSWMGHYRTITGYDDAKKVLIVQDSYIKADLTIDYDGFVSDWRSFNFVFLVAYSKDKEDRLSALLGDYNDPVKSYQIALKTATNELGKLGGVDQYFAWYNRGSSLVLLQDYNGAAEAYDKAYQLYANLPEDRRPWREIWHETGPYYAYFYAGRIQDTANLATNTLDYITRRAERLGISDKPQVGPFIEETWVWRARAREMLGDKNGAISDLRMAIKYHPGFQAALDEFAKLGVKP